MVSALDDGQRQPRSPYEELTQDELVNLVIALRDSSEARGRQLVEAAREIADLRMELRAAQRIGTRLSFWRRAAKALLRRARGIMRRMRNTIGALRRRVSSRLNRLRARISHRLRSRENQ